MSKEPGKVRVFIGIVVSAVIFMFWITVDLYYFPTIGETLGYPVFEVVAYGSWFLVLLIILVILSYSGSIPGRYSRTDVKIGDE